MVRRLCVLSSNVLLGVFLLRMIFIETYESFGSPSFFSIMFFKVRVVSEMIGSFALPVLKFRFLFAFFAFLQWVNVYMNHKCVRVVLVGFVNDYKLLQHN